MRIAAVETARVPEHPEILWVLVETEDGQVGTGETMPRVAAVEAIVHDVLAPLLIGADVAPAGLWQSMFQAVQYHGWAGAELRAMSAVDIALWDLVGQAAGLPVHRLLGGPVRDRVPVYNTCASHGCYRDRERFLTDPAGLARELADEGYAAMKIWPFDEMSIVPRGQRVASRAELRATARLFGDIRDAVGDDIEVALEGHSCWSLPAAVEIARELEPFRPMWLEDMLPATDPRPWRSLREATSTPICGSERVFTRFGLAPFLEADAVDVVKQDLCWTGGFTEWVRVAALADLHARPVAPHNCHGPIGAMATLHAAAATPNLFLMESVRAFARTFFTTVAEGAPVIADGWLDAPKGPGLGVRLRPDVLARADRRRTTAAGPVAWGAGDPWAGDVGDRV